MNHTVAVAHLKSKFVCVSIFLTLLLTLLFSGRSSVGACGTINQERACIQAANASYENCVRDMAWYNPGRIYCSIQHSFAVDTCTSPCGGG